MRYLNDAIISAGDASADITGTLALDLSNIISISFQAVATSTATGTLKVQVSNDYGPAVGNLAGLFVPTNWTDLANATVAIAGAGSYLIPKIDVSYQFLRLVYTRDSGSGTLTVRCKTIGW